MQVFERHWVVIGNDWDEASVDAQVHHDEVSFMVLPDLQRLPTFLAFVSLVFPNAFVVFDTTDTPAPMVLGKGTYGKNTYGDKK